MVFILQVGGILRSGYIGARTGKIVYVREINKGTYKNNKNLEEEKGEERSG